MEYAGRWNDFGETSVTFGLLRLGICAVAPFWAFAARIGAKAIRVEPQAAFFQALCRGESEESTGPGKAHATVKKCPPVTHVAKGLKQRIVFRKGSRTKTSL